MSNVERYDNPILAEQYEMSEQGSNNGDVEFYTKLAKDCGGSVLELACGTGRITIPLNKSGIDVTGVDIASEMIKIAKKKAARNKSKIKFVVADATRFKTAQKYSGIIIAYNSMAMLDERGLDRLIKTAKSKLVEDGIFAFDISVPNKNYAKAPLLVTKDWSEPIKIKSSGVRLRRKIVTKRSADRKKTKVTYFWEVKNKNGKFRRFKTSINFITHELDWYITKFSDAGFKIRQKKFIRHKDKNMDHVFAVMRKKGI